MLSQDTDKQWSGTLLAGDIGATKTLLAVFNVEDGTPLLLRDERFVTKDCGDFRDTIKKFLGNEKMPDAISFGVAGPVIDGRVTITNISRTLDSKLLAAALNVPVHFINDLEATTHGISQLSAEDLCVVAKGKENASGNIAVIAPGTGLGEGAAFWDGKKHHPFPTEGGHCSFAASTPTDTELFNYLGARFHHVSWERVISGQGIVNIFEFLHNKREAKIPDWLQELLFDGNAAKVISSHAEQVDICKQTMNLFFRYLAEEAAHLALKTNATGGLFIGGGILPQVLRLFDANVFMQNFTDFGRIKFLLEAIPVKIILNPKTALLGAAVYGVRKGGEINCVM